MTKVYRMKKYLYLLLLPLSLTNCYTYKIPAESEEVPAAKQETPVAADARNPKIAMSANQATMDMSEAKVSRTRPQNKPAKPKPTSVTEKLEPNKFYKIDVADRSYKIQVKKWESDTLVANVIHKPKKILKFHKNQINQSTIAERRFSQPVADILTVAAYTGIGVGIWALVSQ